ncbi:MAG: HAMP domain-containing protein [Firmicutes bacterium]|nr:HAMP domain-containing protein [Bacillota bacterium]
MKSARTRIAINFIFIIIVTVIILEVLIIGIIKHNYNKNLEENLISQIKTSADLYSSYFSDASLYDNVLNNVDTFWKQVPAQVEIIDTNGKVLMDSIGVIPADNSKMPDVKAALKGKLGKWTGKTDYSKEMVMAVSYPLKSQGKIVGVLRFISSLREVKKAVGKVASVLIFIGMVVVLISGFISLLLADTIVGPLEEITAEAEKMAEGNFKIRCKKRYNDEVGKLSDTLNYMAQVIQEKDRLKNEFICSVSHELRTPLTSIKGWAVTLKNIGLEDKDILIDGLEIIEKESERLTSMVEELLDFSRFVSGNISIKKEKVDISKVMYHIEKQLVPRAQRENIGFSVFCENKISHIIGDENRLKQIFINVLDNSFKFTPPGGQIVFTAVKEGNNVRFSIKDTGCGISPEELPRVKEKFFKGKNSKSKNGIGLSICDEIIKLLNGTFEIKSEVNRGTEAIIILPVGEVGYADEKI